MNGGSASPGPRSRHPRIFRRARAPAALRALADFTLAAHREGRESARRRQRPRHPPDWGRMRTALWQRAVKDKQRRIARVRRRGG